MLWAIYEAGTRGRINVGDFGWAGAILFVIGIPYYTGWLLLTARRLRAADISRSWLIFAILSINVPVGDVYVNITLLATLMLTVVAALARDRDPAPAV